MKRTITCIGLLLLTSIGRAQAPEGVEAVDLGLPSGTKWATMNVGATFPGGWGNRYAFGELEPKTEYTKEKHIAYYPDMVHEYVIRLRSRDISGTVNDVAHVRWGGKWRMPTRAEFEEFYNTCSGEAGSVNGYSGTWYTGPNGNRVFLPSCDNKSGYWTSTPKYQLVGGSPMYNEGQAYYKPLGTYMWFDGTFEYYLRNWYEGSYVRPVMSDDKPGEEVPLIELDEEEDWEPVSASGIIKFTKTFRRGWNTLCVPFGVYSSSRQLSQFFGNRSYTLYAFSGYEDGVFKFTKAGTEVSPNTPYLLYYDGSTNEEKVTRFLTYDRYGLPGTTAGTPEKVVGDFAFTGSYSNLPAGNKTISSNDYLLNKRYFQVAGQENGLKAFEAFIKNTEGEDISPLVQLSTDGVTLDSRIVLDENSTDYPEPTEGDDDLRVKRTIVAGEWNTLALPFSMSEAQVKSVFGDDVRLKQFVRYETNENVTSIKVIFEDAHLAEDGLMANTPYIIMTTRDISEFLVTATVEPGWPHTEFHFEDSENGVFRYGYFIGTYVAETPLPENTLFLSDNRFWYSTGKTKMKGYRAFFDFMDVLGSQQEANARIVLSFDETTGLKGIIEKGKFDDKTYDLQGRRIETPRKGFYIRNGRKYIK